MELNIARERVVSVTKHDLNAPIGTIKHKTFELRINKSIRLDDDYLAVNRYDIYDIGVCTMMCLNLVTQLDADPYSFIPNAKTEQISVEGRVIAPLKNMLAHFASEQNDMHIYYDGFDKFPELWLDASLMQRVVFNLLTNAVKYGENKTQIKITGRIVFDGYDIDIQNMGPGIEIDETEKVFTPKYRSPRTEKMGFGLGLGLSIARACLEKCNCKLLLTKPKNPTIFTIHIPRHLGEGNPQQNTGT